MLIKCFVTEWRKGRLVLCGVFDCNKQNNKHSHKSTLQLFAKSLRYQSWRIDSGFLFLHYNSNTEKASIRLSLTSRSAQSPSSPPSHLHKTFSFSPPTSRIRADSPLKQRPIDVQRDLATPRRAQHRPVRDRQRIQHDIRRQRGNLARNPL